MATQFHSEWGSGRKGLQLPESLRIWEEVRGRKRGDLQDIFKKEKKLRPFDKISVRCNLLKLHLYS